jgi:hypothetical protein
MVTPLSDAIALIGLKPVASACGVTHQAVLKWLKRGRLPRTEYSGETNYAELIARACRDKDRCTKITRTALLCQPGVPTRLPAQERVA